MSNSRRSDLSFGRFFRRLHRGEEAQGMVFGAISLFMLAACIGLVHNSGVITSRRIETQNAADAAAYSGSLVTANIISDVAWMNDGMAYVYYNMMRYAVDVTIYRTIAEMRDHNKWMWMDGRIRKRNDYLDP
ncbi:MAG: Tad domain-containing protein, partial [Planctomycetes bacterium]|nr:Tad domain-containing protein [Planctomycetota bacterium]